MELMSEWSQKFLVCATTFGVVTCAAYFVSLLKGKVENYALAALLVCLAIMQINTISLNSVTFSWWTALPEHIFVSLYGPYLLLNIRFIFGHKPHLISLLLQTIPYVVALTITFFFPKNAFQILKWFLLLHATSYLILSMRVIWVNAKQQATAEKPPNDKYLRRICLGLFGLTSFSILVLASVIPVAKIAILYIENMIAIYIQVIALASLVGVRTRKINDSLSKGSNESEGFVSETTSYKSKLDVLMESEKLFLENALTLEELAAKLDLNHRQMSILINEQLGESFFDYLVQRRLQFAKHLLDELPKESLSSIATQSGFLNENSFIRQFKKYYSTCPEEYRKQRVSA